MTSRTIVEHFSVKVQRAYHVSSLRVTPKALLILEPCSLVEFPLAHDVSKDEVKKLRKLVTVVPVFIEDCPAPKHVPIAELHKKPRRHHKPRLKRGRAWVRSMYREGLLPRERYLEFMAALDGPTLPHGKRSRVKASPMSGAMGTRAPPPADQRPLASVSPLPFLAVSPGRARRLGFGPERWLVSVDELNRLEEPEIWATALRRFEREVR